MRIAYLVVEVTATDEGTRGVLAQARAMAEHHDVQVVNLLRSGEVALELPVRHLVDLREPRRPVVDPAVADAVQAARWHQRASALVRPGWDRKFTALTDAALEHALGSLDVDAVVSTSPGLLAAAVELTPAHVVVAHHDHRPSVARTPEALLQHAPAADVVVAPTEVHAAWIREQLGEVAPEVVVLPDPLEPGFRPRSRLDRPVITAVARLVPDKQLPKLVAAFAEVAEQLPGWRLRIVGEGPQRVDVVRQVRRHGLWDRVEVVTSVPDLPGVWATSAVCAIASRSEGFALGALEAMAAGVPVVAFDAAAGVRELVEHEGNGLLVAPESVAGLAAALLRIATDETLRRKLGDAAAVTSRGYEAGALAERWTRVLGDARAARAARGRWGARAAAKPRRVPQAQAPEALLDVASRLTPAQARHEALAWTVRAARETRGPWFVVPPHGDEGPLVVLPAGARDRLLSALAEPGAPAHLSLREPEQHGWPERRGTPGAMAERLRGGRTPLLCVEPWPVGVLGQGASVTVELWEVSAAGDLVAPRRNRFAESVPLDRLAPDALADVEVDGVTVPSLPLLAAPALDTCRFPVDVVYTWVDGADPGWNADREQRLAGVTGDAAHTAQTRESSGQARYLDRDELRYSLRSIHLFAPWARRIHLVTAGQVPAWLDVDHPRVNLVHHRDLLPAEALPTFNSHAIETGLHRIEGLSEQFVYFNDDFLLARPVPPERFFSPSGQNAVFPSPSVIGLSDLPEAPPYLRAAWNNRALLAERFGATITHHLAHAPYAHRVSVVEAVHQAFPEALAATARSPFRAGTDVSTLSSLAQHLGLLTGESYLSTADLAYVNLSNADVDRQLEEVLERRQDFICLGDHHDHALRATVLDRLLAEFYPAYYPVPAPWERT